MSTNDNESESITPASNAIEIEPETATNMDLDTKQSNNKLQEVQCCCCILPKRWTKCDMTLWTIIALWSIGTSISAMRYWSFSEAVYPEPMEPHFKVSL